MSRKSVTTFGSEEIGPKSMRTRERILDAAAHVLSRKGYAGTRLTDVAEQADLQAPAIYYYFSSREDLIEVVMWIGITQIREYLDETLAALPPDTEPMDRIITAVEAHLRAELEVSDYTTAAIRNAGQVPESIRTRYADEAAKYNETWCELIHAADRAGALRSDLDLRITRLMVLGALNWATEWWNPHYDALDSVISTTKSLVRHSLEASEQNTSDVGMGSSVPRPPAPTAAESVL